jgi:hypothetical protein
MSETGNDGNIATFQKIQTFDATCELRIPRLKSKAVRLVRNKNLENCPPQADQKLELS